MDIKKNFALILIVLQSVQLFGQPHLISYSKNKTNTYPTPNYQVVFPQNKVNTLEITVSKTDWDSISAEMKTKFGNEFGKGGNFNRPPMMQPDGKRPPMPPGEGNFPPMGGGPPFGGGGKEPSYVPVSLTFNGKVWKKVGFRLKGNSSLMMSWTQGIYKLPFRLSFDEFEKQFPETKNRRFFGFKELSMSPGSGDNSLIREKITADIFRKAGIPAAQTAFYKVYLNFGEGPNYCGVYTMVEVIDDTMVKTQFGEAKGNIYKPESTFSRFNTRQFEKKNNKKKADYGDVQAFVKALNDDSLRTENAAQWRANLEKTFNVAHFLNYLAVNNSIVNWDAYGGMAHNHYLYNSPTKRLTWIPWDNNEAMKMRGFGGMRPMAEMGPPPEGFKPPEGFGPPPNFRPGGGRGGGVSLEMKEVGKQWPLIRYLADDPIYFAQYKKYVKEFSEKVFTEAQMQQLFAKNHALIAPFVNGKLKEERPYSHLRNSDDFGNGLPQLNEHVTQRTKAIKAFLESTND
ncbi:CotH kinase family protein [Runella sp.]|uniref:CotH kinase family protein n=1 Tax=Runella sp. TaxID=1960881 RepID=UPI003D0C2BD5